MAIGCSPHFLCDSDGLIKKIRAGAVQPRPFTCHRHILAGRTECDYVNRLEIRPVQYRDVSVMFHEWQPFRGNSNWKRFDLRCPHRDNTGDQTAQRETAGTVKKAAQCQTAIIHGAAPPLSPNLCKRSSSRHGPQKYPPAQCRSQRRVEG